MNVDNTYDDEDTYNPSRIMTDLKYQGHGYETKALSEIVDLVKAFLHGEESSLILSSYSENKSAY